MMEKITVCLQVIKHFVWRDLSKSGSLVFQEVENNIKLDRLLTVYVVRVEVSEIDSRSCLMAGDIISDFELWFLIYSVYLVK
jgi:hypothetical protein